MNLAQSGSENADTFHLERNSNLSANPPLNAPDWFRKDNDARWEYGVPPKGSMSSNQSGEGDHVDCIVALPGQLFYSTQIPEMFQKAV